MRRRLLIGYILLLTVVCIALAAPLAGSIAARNTSSMLIDRQGDTARFAGMAEQTLLEGEPGPLAQEIGAYDELYGIGVIVVDPTGEVATRSPSARGQDLDRFSPDLDAALAGARADSDTVIWPWQRGPVLVSEPVARSGEIIGVVATISPTGALRSTTAYDWGFVGAAVLTVLVVGLAAALPVINWLLRPVHDLDAATRAIAHGELGTRVRVSGGPPELRHLAGSFNQMADEVTALMERQQNYASYASHQLRNPLAALRVRMETVGQHLEEPGREDHSLALEEIDRLNRLCDSLLALARSEAGAEEAEEVDAAAVAAERVVSWTLIADRAGATLLVCGARHSLARCPAGTLDQTLDVLIDNALKFGGRGVRIIVHVGRPRDGAVEVYVTDDGPGLPEEDLANATAPFWQSDATGDSGTGLGLPIIATLLAVAGGSLRLQPVSPHGIEAIIRLRTTPPA